MIDILNEKIEELTKQKQAIDHARWELEQEFLKKMSEHFSKFFRGIVTEDVKINCLTSSIQFHKMNEEGTYDKEMFNLYLKENYFSEKELPYRDVELSYYTTSTNSEWELQRVINLGKVAETLSKFKEQIVTDANNLRISYREDLEKGNYWRDTYDINKQIEDIKKVIKEQKVNSIKEQLFKDGVQFTKAAHIQLKFNYIPQLKSIKLAEVGKSGKKATALLTHFHGGYVSTEQNVDVTKVVEQVLGYSNIVAEPEMA
jgi:hypothetical protein